MKKAYISDTGKDSALHLHCSGLPADRASIWYNSFTWKMVLERPLLVTMGDINCSGCLRNIALQVDMKFYSDDGLKKAIH